MDGNKRIIIICAIAAAVAVGIWYYTSRAKADDVVLIAADGPASGIQEETEGAPGEAETGRAGEMPPAMIYVHVAGEVNRPGLYELPEGSRVADAVELAGGFTPDAGQDVNLARIVSDGEKIDVAKAGETAPEDAAEPKAEEGDELVNINTATKEELMTLPGVGEVIAGGIIRHREKNGPFQSKEGLVDVPRIGEKLYMELEDLITVD